MVNFFLNYICFNLLLFSFISCNEFKKINEDNKQIVLKDYFDRQIEIKRDINRVIPLYYVQAEVICALGASNKIVGIGRLMKTQSIIIDNYFPRLYEIPQVGNQNNFDLEKIISLNPDLIFCGTEKESVSRLEQLHLSTFSTYPKYPADILEQIRMYGMILNKENNSKVISTFLDSLYNLVKSKTLKINKSNYPSVYYARTDKFTTLGKGVNDEIIKTIGGRSVTENLPEDINGLKVTLEDIYKWNPDIIIIRDRASFTPEDLYNDSDWSMLKAIKNKKVFKETYGWTEFRFGTFFGIQEKAKWLHPDDFRDLDPEINYKRFIDLILSLQD